MIEIGEKVVNVEGKRFFIEIVRAANSKNQIHQMNADTDIEIYTGDEGGYFSMNENVEIVDALVFCAKSERYEIVKATYNKLNGMYYIDSGIYRDFVKRNGFIIANIGAYDNGKFSTLNSKSLLRHLGYNVNSQEELSDTMRQALLADIIDTQMMTVKQIVILLKLFIQRNGKKEANAFALMKWETDLKFVESYRVNPTRFVFASIVNKRIGQCNYC